MDREQLIAAMRAAAADAVQPRLVPVPVLGSVYVRDVTVAEVDANIAEDGDAEGKATSNRGLARSACRVICDETGRRLFDANNKDDLALIGSLPWSILRTILDKADSTAGKAPAGAASS